MQRLISKASSDVALLLSYDIFKYNRYMQSYKISGRKNDVAELDFDGWIRHQGAYFNGSWCDRRGAT